MIHLLNIQALSWNVLCNDYSIIEIWYNSGCELQEGTCEWHIEHFTAQIRREKIRWLKDWLNFDYHQR